MSLLLKNSFRVCIFNEIVVWKKNRRIYITDIWQSICLAQKPNSQPSISHASFNNNHSDSSKRIGFFWRFSNLKETIVGTHLIWMNSFLFNDKIYNIICYYTSGISSLLWWRDWKRRKEQTREKEIRRKRVHRFFGENFPLIFKFQRHIVF